MKLSRRHFLAGAGAAAAATALSSDVQAQRKPNVVIILTDDQGWGDVDIRETVLMQTPNLRALAMGGCQFERFYVSPVCAPTRARAW